MYYINRIERAIETYREECETSKKPEAMRCYREVYEYYIAEEEKTVAQIASEECVSEKTVYKDIGNCLQDHSCVPVGCVRKLGSKTVENRN